MPLLTSEFDKDNPPVSPDGHWVAYDSNESGKDEIYAVAFPNATARFQISTAGGSNVQWRAEAESCITPTPTTRSWL